MTETAVVRSVKIEFQIRISCPTGPGSLADILALLKQEGGDLRAHLVYQLGEQIVGLFVCERPTEAADALRKRGIQAETETVVVVRTDNRWGALSHLIRVLEGEGIRIGYSYASAFDPELCIVVRTDDNPKAEDVLRNYLILPDPEAAD